MSAIKDKIVQSYNEWDPLEEVIVGRVEGAVLSNPDEIDLAALGRPMKTAMAPPKKFPQHLLDAAQEDVEGFIELLVSHGIAVKRPDAIDWEKQVYATPDWQWNGGGFNQANPRDLLMVVGESIIETSTGHKNRYFETNAYRQLLLDYNLTGCHWKIAPKPTLTEESFVYIEPPAADTSLVLDRFDQIKFPLSEKEPIFEAADFMRCGTDIFYQLSYVTNRNGIQWLQNQLGPAFNFHEIKSKCRRPLHLDTTFIPLAPGKALINPDFVAELPDVLSKWDVRPAPQPIANPQKSSYQFGSDWLSMNLFSIDSKFVFVEKRQTPLIDLLKDWSFEPIPVQFENFYILGGGLHCSTLDIRRKGDLQSYFI